MTGFRVAFGGASELYGIKPDLTTLGKIIGGGLPVGAYGGAAELMDMIAPARPGVPGRNAERQSAGHGGGHRDAGASSRRNREPFYKQLDEMSGQLVGGIRRPRKKPGLR